MQSIQASLDTARQAHSQQSGKDLSARLSSLHHSSLSPEAKEKKLREACEGFESIFIQKMWQEMRKTVNQGSFLHGREEQFWQDMYDQELAKKMTSAGGIGLANMMYEQLSSHLSSASRATARAQDNGRAFAPSQAPLLGNTASASTPLDLTGQTQAKAEGPKASPLYEEPKDVATSEKSPEKSASTPSGSSHPGESPVATAHPTPTASVEPPTPSVDPAIAQALDMMRHSVETNPQVSPAPLAHVNYTVPGARQQPVASGMDLAKAAQRQAGDQLGSRGCVSRFCPRLLKPARPRKKLSPDKRPAMPDVSLCPMPFPQARLKPRIRKPRQPLPPWRRAPLWLQIPLNRRISDLKERKDL